MKRLVFCLLIIPLSTNAQKVEVALKGGFSTNTNPSNNMPYKGNQVTFNYASSFQAIFNINDNLQTGIESTLTELSMKSGLEYTTFWGNKIGNDDKRFVYAKTAVSVCGLFNGRAFTNGGYGYGGVALGYGAARHNSKTLGSNESYRAPDGGNGVVWGMQLGYVRGISQQLAINAEVALRHYTLNYDAMEPTGTTMENLKYSIMSFPVTVGFRYRFASGITREKHRQDSMNSRLL